MEIEKDIKTFEKLCRQLKINFKGEICIENLPKGNKHKVKQLPPNKMAVYMFFEEKKCLKVGKASTNANARFQYQHYNKNGAKSCLAKSLLNDPDREHVDPKDIKQWIKNNTIRINLYIQASNSISVLNFLESYFQVIYTPVYEGFKSQQKQK